MPVCRCWQCGFEKRVESLEEAQRLARVHMSMIGCIMVFGYTDAKYREALGQDGWDAIDQDEYHITMDRTLED